jgi:hypothetical protein
MIMIERIGNKKTKKIARQKETKANEDDKWERADNFTNIVTRSGNQRRIQSRANS